MMQIPGLTGGGGAERFFADFFETYSAQKDPKHELFFISDDIKPLQKVGYFQKVNARIIFLKNYRFFRFAPFKFIQRIISRTVGNYLLERELLRAIRTNKIEILHITLYELRDLHLYKAVSKMPKLVRPKIVLNIVDCRIPYMYDSAEYFSSSRAFYEPIFKSVPLSAIFSWYEKFRDFARSENLIHSEIPIVTIHSRYSPFNQSDAVLSKKSKRIVWASRVDYQKDPMFFVEAIRILTTRQIPSLQSWKFLMYGKGPLHAQIKSKIQEYGLSNYIEQDFSDRMPEVFAQSKCYVSTQLYENFPSLAMAEAMGTGNAIIAKDVGQTNLFVRNNVNGFLHSEDSAEHLANALEKFISMDEERQNEMGRASLKLLKEVHNRENFFAQADALWDKMGMN